MKKTIATLLCLCLLAGLSACSENIEATTTATTPTASVPETTVPATTLPEESAVAIYDGSIYAVSMPTVTENSSAADGTVIYSYTYPSISISLQDADIAEIITLKLLNRIDASAGAAAAIHDAAKASYKASSDFIPYCYDVQYNVTHLSQNILSFYCTEASYDGSPRSLRSRYALNFDLATGNELNLRTVLQNDYSADILCQLIIDGLSSYDQSALFPDYQTTIHDKFSTNVPVDSWYFTGEGLCFYFEPYEIAPVSMGDIVSVVPYDKLSGMMDEQFFPAEHSDYIGNIALNNITGNIEDSLAGYNQFSELTLDTGADHLLLVTDGSVTDLRIYNGSFSDKDSGHTVMLYAAAALGPGHAVLIEADADTIDGNWLITYKTATETKQCTITHAPSGDLTIIE